MKTQSIENILEMLNCGKVNDIQAKNLIKQSIVEEEITIISLNDYNIYKNERRELK
ncbi:MAG: hypothetical protein WC212_04295 [Candidatus Delongbacteria bacterium]